MKQEDIDFLKSLQNELKKQDEDVEYSCWQANPRYWCIMETIEEVVPDGCGDARILYDGYVYKLEDFVKLIEEDFEGDDTSNNDWENTDKSNFEEVRDFAEYNLGLECSIVEVANTERISQETGCFLTKKAAQEYLKRYGYNHPAKSVPFALTAYRNYEFERLLRILTTMDIDDIKIK